MADSLRTDSTRALDAASEADRDAKIEHLLLVGLDHYFAARYDEAINVWTRALFLDRNHARARAYIERARSALAERQRESEELLQKGVAAFARGESDQARSLLQRALESGAPSDEALAVLDRLNRLETAPSAPAPAWVRRDRGSMGSPPVVAGRAPSRVRLAVSILLLMGVVLTGVYAAGSWDAVDWLVRPATGAAAPPPPVPTDVGPSAPRRGEIALARARSLVGGGHLRDALAALDLVRSTDPQKPDADRLRGEIQRQLLRLAPATQR